MDARNTFAFPHVHHTSLDFFSPSPSSVNNIKKKGKGKKKKKQKKSNTFLTDIYTSKYFLCIYSQYEMIFNELSVSENSSVNQQGCRQFLPYVGSHLYHGICCGEDEISAFLSLLMC